LHCDVIFLLRLRYSKKLLCFEPALDELSIEDFYAIHSVTNRQVAAFYIWSFGTRLYQNDAAEIGGTKKREVSYMRVLRFIQKWLCKLRGSGVSLSAGIDSHKWESKIEILGRLSSRCS